MIGAMPAGSPVRRTTGVDRVREAGEERQHELDPAHLGAAKELTARTCPVGGTGSRCGSDQRAVMTSGCRRRPAIPIRSIGPYGREGSRKRKGVGRDEQRAALPFPYGRLWQRQSSAGPGPWRSGRSSWLGGTSTPRSRPTARRSLGLARNPWARSVSPRGRASRRSRVRRASASSCGPSRDRRQTPWQAPSRSRS